MERAKDTKTKVTQIHDAVKGLINDELLNKMRQTVDFLDADVRSVVNQCDYRMREYHHVIEASRKEGEPRIYGWGDLEFVNQFAKTQIFASFIDKLIDDAKDLSQR